MAGDNTQLNVGIGGDLIRTKNVGGIKTEIVQLDLGGETAENLIIAGQKTMANSVPVVPASDYVPVLQQDLILNANNYYPNRTWDFILGRNTLVNNTRVDLWEGPTPVYVFPTTPQQMRVVSTSASDTALGTGMQVVDIHYLDANYNVQSELVTLNGVTPVLTVATNILRINGFHATRVGTTGASVGNISLQNTTGTVTYGFILAGFNRAHQAIFTVPAGKTGYIQHWQYSSGTATGSHFTEFYIRSTSHIGVLYTGTFLSVDTAGTLNNGASSTYPTPIRIPATADVKVSALSDSAASNAICNTAVMGWFE